ICAVTFPNAMRESPRNLCRPPASLTHRDRRRDVPHLTLSVRHQNVFFWTRLKAPVAISQEHTMKKVILITIAVASLSTTALADARVAKHRTLHRQVVMGVGVSPALL